MLSQYLRLSRGLSRLQGLNQALPFTLLFKKKLHQVLFHAARGRLTPPGEIAEVISLMQTAVDRALSSDREALRDLQVTPYP